MDIKCKNISFETEACDALVVGLYQNQTELNLEQSDKLNQFCTEVLSANDFKGELGEVSLLYTHGQFAANRLVLVGLGEKEKVGLQQLRQAAGTVANNLKSRGLAGFSLATETFFPAEGEINPAAQALVEGMVLANYEYLRFKKQNADKSELGEVSLLYQSEDDKSKIEAGASRGKKVADATNFTRDLQNHPGNWLTPTKLAEAALEVAKEVGLKCEVLEKTDMEKLGMGVLLGVAKGSEEPPKFIVLEHNHDRSNFETIVFVGKAVTFDSGGISIKPSQKMEEMKFDMSGGAAVMGALKAIAELHLPFHVVGLIPATENLPSGTSMKPGDILTASSGTTIEVVNTDAEGRLILADALTYAKKYNPKAVVDLATLTGACVIALGHYATGLMGNDQSLMDRLQQAGEKTGERLWQLPLWEEYHEDVKGDYADIKNSGGRAGGAITAAAFLGKFTEDYPWAHLDIAGTAWTTSDKPHMKKGGTGLGVRLLVEFLRNR